MTVTDAYFSVQLSDPWYRQRQDGRGHCRGLLRQRASPLFNALDMPMPSTFELQATGRKEAELTCCR